MLLSSCERRSDPASKIEQALTFMESSPTHLVSYNKISDNVVYVKYHCAGASGSIRFRTDEGGNNLERLEAIWQKRWEIMNK